MSKLEIQWQGLTSPDEILNDVRFTVENGLLTITHTRSHQPKIYIPLTSIKLFKVYR